MILHSRAPTRISFAGGGTDLPEIAKIMGGCVTSAAITKYVYGTLKERDDKKLVITSMERKKEVEIADAKKIRYNGKLDLIKSVSEELNKEKLGFDITISSEVPRHSGLGASAAAYAAVIGLFDKFYKLKMTRKEMAELSFRLETEKLGNRVGKQDQYAAVFGGLNFMKFSKGMHVSIKPVKAKRGTIEGLEKGLALFHVVGREKTSGQTISKQVRGPLEGFRKTKELGLMAKEALENDDLEEFGRVMSLVWKYKKMFGGMTTKFIDDVYEAAVKAGAYGGKISGAGGGGCGFWFCRPNKKETVIKALQKGGAVYMPFSFDFEGIEVWKE